MCIALLLPKNVKLSKETAILCAKANPDGAGFAYVENDRINIKKGYFDFEKFWKDFNEVQENNNETKLVHFRIASAGVKDDFNCHPFRIDEKHAVIHNGTLWGFWQAKAQVSDTFIFTHNILKPMFERDAGLFKTKFGQYLIEETISSYSKLVILGADGEAVIFNESEGVWDDAINGKIWFSNRSYLPPPPPKKKHKKKDKFAYQGIKKAKPSGYRALQDILAVEEDICIEKGELLTLRQINQLTHYYRKQWKQRCRKKNLIYRKVIEPIFKEEIKNKEKVNLGSPSNYLNHWEKRALKTV